MGRYCEHWFGSSSILHSLWYHCREGYMWGVCITIAKSAWWSTLLLQLWKFTPVGGNYEVYLPDKGTGAYELPKVVECSTANLYLYWCWNVNHAAKCKLPSIEVAELAVWPCNNTKACCVMGVEASNKVCGTGD